MAPTNEYLTAQVLTATPQKLHLMLIDGAIRFVQQAKQIWDDEARRHVREEALTRCVKISGEMLASIRSSALPAGKQFVAVYTWLFRTMTEAKLLGDQARLNEALELLFVERETWRLVCEKFGADVEPAPKPAATSAWATTSDHEFAAGSLSLEA
jgi:flagellar protein FliS